MAKTKSKKEIALANLKGFISAEDIKPSRLIPTGHPDLDYVLSASILEERKTALEKGEKLDIHELEAGGGFPSGKIVMVYGGEGSGKSSIAYRVCGNAQKMGLMSAWLDIEHSFAPDLAKINNLDISGDFLLSSFGGDDFYAEAVMDMAIDAVNSGEIDVLVVDSVAALVPKYVLDNPTEKDTMALLARVLSKSLGKLAQAAAANNVLVLFINQLRVNPGIMFGNPEGCPGGKALAHFCSVICKMQKVESKADRFVFVEDEEGNPVRIAGNSYIRIEKNRFAEPHDGSLMIPVYYKPYQPSIDDHAFNLGRQLKLISVRKNIFKYEDVRGEGRGHFMTAVRQEGKMTDLIDAIKEAAVEKSLNLPREILNYDDEVVVPIDEEQDEAELVEADNPEL